jgi:uncharacterized membrane protein YhaH (DUF805 family)
MEFLKQRINRATYWLYIAILLAFGVAASFFNVSAGGISLVLAIPYILRMHDLGWTGKWVLLVYVLQFVFGIAMAVTLSPENSLVGLGVMGLAVSAWIILLGSLRGQVGPNSYGVPPRPGISFKSGETTK